MLLLQRAKRCHLAGAGMRWHVHSGNHAAESFAGRHRAASTADSGSAAEVRSSKNSLRTSSPEDRLKSQRHGLAYSRRLGHRGSLPRVGSQTQ